MIGLPARGKSYISEKLHRYFSWKGLTSKIFNAGNKRRELYEFENSESFFNPVKDNERNRIAEDLLLELIRWLFEGNNKIGIFDATNSDTERRKKIIETIELFKFNNLKVCFIESFCNIQEIIDQNIEMKMYSPDYLNKSKSFTIEDFNKRMLYYKSVYKEFDTKEIEGKENYSYIKITNINQLYNIYNGNGYYLSNIVFFLLNVNIDNKKIYLTRHGESQYNVKKLIGGDSSLSDKGKDYAFKLYEYIISLDNYKDIKIFTSSLKRTKETAMYLSNNKHKVIEKKCLDEIDAGLYDSLTYDNIKEQYPEDYEMRKKDKLNYRYPRGESYKDLILRVEKIIMDVESSNSPILIIAHQAIIRVIYSYFMNIKNKEMPELEVPLHCIIELTPQSHNFKEKRTYLSL